MFNLSIDDVEFIKYYEDQSTEGSYDDYSWGYIPDFNISLMGNYTDWIQEESKSFIEEFGYDRYGEIKKWWLDIPEKEPVIIIQQADKQYSTWDGAHRIGISFLHGMKTVPAFVGINKSIKK